MFSSRLGGGFEWDIKRRKRNPLIRIIQYKNVYEW